MKDNNTWNWDELCFLLCFFLLFEDLGYFGEVVDGLYLYVAKKRYGKDTAIQVAQ